MGTFTDIHIHIYINIYICIYIYIHIYTYICMCVPIGYRPYVIYYRALSKEYMARLAGYKVKFALWQNTGLFGKNTCLFWQELGFFWYLPHRYPDWIRHGDTWMRNPSGRLLRSNAVLHGVAVCCSRMCHIVFRAQAKSFLPSVSSNAVVQYVAVRCVAFQCASVYYSVLPCSAVSSGRTKFFFAL